MTIRKYGLNKYGDGKLYGPTDVSETLAWDISVDWDGDGIYESNEAEYVIGISISRGRTRYIKPNGQGFEPVRTGVASVTLSNHDRRYDGWNTSSPLYPNVVYGKKVRLRVRDMSEVTETIYPLFVGTITNIDTGDYGKDAKVVLQLSDAMEYLRNTNARVALQTDITVDEAIDMVLNAANFGTQGGRNLDATAGDVIDFWWSDGDKLSMSQIEDLAFSFLGYFFIDRDGNARFVKRTSATDSVLDLDQSILLKDIDNPQPYEIRRNLIRIKAHPRTTSTVTILWQLLGNKPVIAPGASNELSLFVSYTYNDVPVPATAVISPLPNTDYTMNTLSDGTGADKTGNCTVSYTDFGNTGKFVIRNNDASAVYVTKLQVRGTAVYEANSAEITYPSDSSTVAAPRSLLFDLLWQQDVNVAHDLSIVMGPFFSQLHPTPNVRLEAQPQYQFIPELFDIVSVTISSIGLTGESLRVSGIEHTAVDNCQAVVTRFYLEPYVTGSDFMQWDVHSVWDTETVFGW